MCTREISSCIFFFFFFFFVLNSLLRNNFLSMMWCTNKVHVVNADMRNFSTMWCIQILHYPTRETRIFISTCRLWAWCRGMTPRCQSSTPWCKAVTRCGKACEYTMEAFSSSKLISGQFFSVIIAVISFRILFDFVVICLWCVVCCYFLGRRLRDSAKAMGIFLMNCF